MRSPIFALLAALLLAAATPAAAQPLLSKPESISVVCDEDYPPYAFRGADGRLQGVVPDLWAEWSKRTGVKVRLEGKPWAEAQRAARAGEVEVIDTIFRTTERMAVFDFTRPYATIEVPVFFHTSISGLASIEDLRGFRVGVKAGDAAIAALRSRGVEDLVEYPGYREIAEAAARTDLRVFTIDGPPGIYWLYRLGIDAQYRTGLILSRGEFRRAVRKGRLDLLDLVQSGFDAIPESVEREIERRWFGKALDAGGGSFLLLAVLAGSAVLVAALLALAAGLRRRVRRATAELREKVLLLEESERRNRAFIAALPDIFFTIDASGRYIDGSTASPELLVGELSALVGRRISETGIEPGLAEEMIGAVNRSLRERRIVVFEYDLEVRAGRRSFEGRVVPLDEDKVIFIARDVTERRISEERLLASLAEKEVLLREVHHRVKNNMQVVSSLVSLQADSFRDERDRELFAETRQRIRAMAQLHELLYGSPTMSSIDAADYVGRVVEELGAAYVEDGARVRISLDLRSSPLQLDEAMPFGLVVNELASNALKHAFPGGRSGTVLVRLRDDEGLRRLQVEDDGVGLPEGLDPLAAEGMGLTLVRSLAIQLEGRLGARSGPGGTSFSLEF